MKQQHMFAVYVPELLQKKRQNIEMLRFPYILCNSHLNQ